MRALRSWQLPLVGGALFALGPSEPDPETALARRDYWHGVSRALATTARGHRVALSCHNCYRHDPRAAASKTAAFISQALSGGADIIELDVTQHPDGVLYVEHEESDKNVPPRLAEVLALPALAGSDRLLFIEIKELEADPVPFGRLLLDTLVAAGYPSEGRPIALRGFDIDQLARLDALRVLLDTDYSSIEPLVRLQELVGHVATAPPELWRAKVDDAVARGFDGIELAMTQPGLFTAIAYARSKGLGVNVYAIGTAKQSGHVFLAALREEADAITTDYPMAGARAILEEQNGLLYLNVAEQTGSGGVVRYFGDEARLLSARVGAAGAPALVHDMSPPASLPGGALVFAGREFIETYDADNAPAPGYLVSASVDFDRLELEEGEKQAIFSKAGGGGFALDLFNPDGSLPTVLRFGVHVGRGFRYSTFPAESLDLTSSFFIVGAYDGAGDVTLWVDGVIGTPATASGSVTGNDWRALVGAAPRGPTTARYPFQGKLQHLLLQRWGPHP